MNIIFNFTNKARKSESAIQAFWSFHSQSFIQNVNKGLTIFES